MAEPGQAEEPPSKHSLLRLLSAGTSFFVAGVNDGSLGALIPHIIRTYGLSTAIASSIYASSFAGWLLTALTNTHISQHLDLGAMLLLGAGLQVVAQLLRCWPTPPFGLYVVTFCLASLGQAYNDTHANTYVAGRKEGTSHRWLGFIHAMYMAGCLVGPFAAASIADGGTGRWWLFYAVPLGMGVGNMVLAGVAFGDTVRVLKVERRGVDVDLGAVGEGVPQRRAMDLLKETLTKRSVWCLNIFFFFYVGATVTAGGWVVEYLVSVRNGDIAEMGYVSAGFNGGGLLGRILLPEPTHRFGERKMLFIYALCSLGLQLLFWLVPNIIAASISISLLGFFLGPNFSTGISVGTRIFPRDISPTAISFLFVFAQMGGSLFPIVTGILAAYVGVSVLQPVMIGLLAAMAVSWLLVPQPVKEKV
ncbi:major facilitator superfamily domain-containing protein [Podospora aff. communis PSN243]|uniref:Major facilitator superfamily domain-containing protein n=1 Tax=Podospora aff. communis PSN243 TaxID=3040156 RepID=A0AAV9GCE2_9PEZI|nr:major facilitator superfamily domain-containing protein [Podospora aff. communis PSN243]